MYPFDGRSPSLYNIYRIVFVCLFVCLFVCPLTTFFCRNQYRHVIYRWKRNLSGQVLIYIWNSYHQPSGRYWPISGRGWRKKRWFMPFWLTSPNSIELIEYIYSIEKGITLFSTYAYCIWGEAEFIVETAYVICFSIPTRVEEI